MRVFVLFVALSALMSSGCGDSSPLPLAEVSDDEILLNASNWPNTVGISADDADLWRERLNRACTDGVWDHDVASVFGEEFMTEDENAGLSIGSAGSEEPTVEHAAQALWLTAVNVCRDQFPPESIDKGPPGLG